MGKLLCENNLRDVWCRNESVRADIGPILQTHTHAHAHAHTRAAKLVVEITLCIDVALDSARCSSLITLRVPVLQTAFDYTIKHKTSGSTCQMQTKRAKNSQGCWYSILTSHGRLQTKGGFILLTQLLLTRRLRRHALRWFAALTGTRSDWRQHTQAS